MADIESNLAAVRERIVAATRRSDRPPTAVTLVAVSKRVDAARIEAAVAAGARVLGESRVQEAEEKIPQVGGDPQWHFIGPLQRNKAALAARLFDVIHSVTRSSLVGRLSTAASAAERQVGVYVQVEPATHRERRAVADVASLCAEVEAAPGLALHGLMTMAPYDPDPEAARPYFTAMRELRDAVAETEATLPELGLSMGMSGDFEVAVEEGATIVRVGTAIFGARPA